MQKAVKIMKFDKKVHLPYIFCAAILSKIPGINRKICISLTFFFRSLCIKIIMKNTKLRKPLPLLSILNTQTSDWTEEIAMLIVNVKL